MTPGMPSVYARPNGTQCKVLHCGGRVGEAESCEGGTEERHSLPALGARLRDAKMERDVSTRCRRQKVIVIIVVFKGIVINR